MLRFYCQSLLYGQSLPPSLPQPNHIRFQHRVYTKSHRNRERRCRTLTAFDRIIHSGGDEVAAGVGKPLHCPYTLLAANPADDKIRPAPGEIGRARSVSTTGLAFKGEGTRFDWQHIKDYNDATLRVAARRDQRPERTLCLCHLWRRARSDQRFRRHDHGE